MISHKKNDAKTYQKLLFRRDSLPEYVMDPREANVELKRNNAKLIPLTDIVGRDCIRRSASLSTRSILCSSR